MERFLYTYNENVGLGLHGFIHGPLLTNYSGLSKVFWADDITMSTYLVNRSPSPTIRFKTLIDMLGFFGYLSSIKQGMLEPVMVKCIFLGYCKGMSLMQVLQGVEFEVEPYREDSNEAAFAVAEAEKIYAHESLTFKNTVDCEMIWFFLADARPRSKLPRVYWIKQREMYLGDCVVEKNDKWLYLVGSQEYQMVCTRLHIASAYVGMLDKFDHGLQTDVQVFVDFDYAMGRSITVMEAAKEAIWLKGLAIESGFELKIVAGIAIGALLKAILGLRDLWPRSRDLTSKGFKSSLREEEANKDIIAQVVSASIVGDMVLATVYAHELPQYGLKVWLTNYATAYCTRHLLACRVLKMLEMDQEYLGNVEIAGGHYVLLLTLAFSELPLAIVFLVLLRNVIHGALDGGLNIPHSEKRFAGFNKDGDKIANNSGTIRARKLKHVPQVKAKLAFEMPNIFLG
ncbi:zinc finger, CCHC-type containing protein [Tanacetum coccineum]